MGRTTKLRNMALEVIQRVMECIQIIKFEVWGIGSGYEVIEKRLLAG